MESLKKKYQKSPGFAVSAVFNTAHLLGVFERERESPKL